MSLNFYVVDTQPVVQPDEDSAFTCEIKQECRGGLMQRNQIALDDRFSDCCEDEGRTVYTLLSSSNSLPNDEDTTSGDCYYSSEDDHQLVSILVEMGVTARKPISAEEDSGSGNNSPQSSPPCPYIPHESPLVMGSENDSLVLAIGPSYGTASDMDNVGVNEGECEIRDFGDIHRVELETNKSTVVAHTGGITRSLACDKHSKWKKKCPHNCQHRKEIIISSSNSCDLKRKLWTKRESSLLLKSVREHNPMQMDTRAGELRWAYIAKSLNRTINSTKKKFMRLTRRWTPRPSFWAPHSHPSYSSEEDQAIEQADMQRIPSIRIKIDHDTHYIIRDQQEFQCRESERLPEYVRKYDDEMWDNSDENFFYPHSGGDKRATVVCEKHRRWKKRCPPDCEDKKSVEDTYEMCNRNTTKAESTYTDAHKRKNATTWHTKKTNKRKRVSRSGRGVGRPAMSCRQHQIEHQKCPHDCPRRPCNSVGADDDESTQPSHSQSPPMSSSPASSSEVRAVRRRESRKNLDPSFLYT